MNIKLLLDAFESMEGATNSEQLRCAMGKFADEMGFGNFVYALTIKTPSLKAQQYVLSGYPPGWVEKYISQDYFKIDPIVKHAQLSTLPIIWDDNVFKKGNAQEFWEEAKLFGLNAGLSFSVHEQSGVTGIFSLSRDKGLDLVGQDLAALIGKAQMFASLLYQAVARIELPKLLPQCKVSLTGRERECLGWAVDGKTAWEIGQILGIAERTVVFHFENIMQKLGATNKTQAIVRAVALKLI
jgi:DNA-binding CsgD family transcriptional regulator